MVSLTWLSLLYKFTRFFIYFLFLSDEGPMLETLDYTIRIGNTPTFLYFDLYLYSAYAAWHYVYYNISVCSMQVMNLSRTVKKLDLSIIMYTVKRDGMSVHST